MKESGVNVLGYEEEYEQSYEAPEFSGSYDVDEDNI